LEVEDFFRQRQPEAGSFYIGMRGSYFTRDLTLGDRT
jgi:hypothetical protein